MAGLLDFLMQPAGRNMLGGLFPEQGISDPRLKADTPLFDIAAGQGPNGWQINLGKPGSLTGDSFADRFGGMQQPEQQPAQAPLPQMQAPQDAAQAFGLPTGSYQFGQQMVPTFGQPQAPQQVDEASAQRRSGSLQINPQGNPVAPQAVAPGATDGGQDKWMEFLDRLSPDYVSRYRQTKSQQKSAQALAQYLQGQNMPPQQAAALAAVLSANPELAKEMLKPPTTMEGSIASPIYGGGGAQGDKVARHLQLIQGKETAQKAGALEAEAAETLKSMQSKMPGLQKVVGELSGLANKATYTLGGQAVDRAMRESGMEPRAAAVARARYISMIDNQILPLLRDTFGAQFTQKEGETLRSTLGNADLSPTEKQQVLEAFIQQKQRDVQALQSRFGGAPAGQPAPQQQGGLVWGQLPSGARFKKVSD